MRMRFLFLALVFLIASCTTAEKTEQQLIEETNLHQQREVILAFVTKAARADVDDLLEELAPVTLQANERGLLRTYLSDRIIPFFKDYRSLESTDSFIKVSDGRGNVGVQHFKHIETNGGSRQPFVITLFPEQGALMVTSIEVGECLPGYHNHCP